jgi:hypothetical protein
MVCILISDELGNEEDKNQLEQNNEKFSWQCEIFYDVLLKIPGH